MCSPGTFTVNGTYNVTVGAVNMFGGILQSASTVNAAIPAF